MISSKTVEGKENLSQVERSRLYPTMRLLDTNIMPSPPSVSHLLLCRMQTGVYESAAWSALCVLPRSKPVVAFVLWNKTSVTSCIQTGQDCCPTVDIL